MRFYLCGICTSANSYSDICIFQFFPLPRHAVQPPVACEFRVDLAYFSGDGYSHQLPILLLDNQRIARTPSTLEKTLSRNHAIVYSCEKIFCMNPVILITYIFSHHQCYYFDNSDHINIGTGRSRLRRQRGATPARTNDDAFL